MSVDIDTILVRNANISYSEIPEGLDVPGTISFNKTFASIYHMTNIPEKESIFKSCNMDIETYINNDGFVIAQLEIPYGEKDQFAFHTTLDSVPLNILDPTLRPLAGITIPSGSIHHLDFHMTASTDHTVNQLVFNYDQLKITILGKNEKKSGYSLLANPLVRSTNLPSKSNYRTANYRVERNMYRGPFNLMWNSLKEGLIVIVPSATAQKLTGQNQKNKK